MPTSVPFALSEGRPSHPIDEDPVSQARILEVDHIDDLALRGADHPSVRRPILTGCGLVSSLEPARAMWTSWGNSSAGTAARIRWSSVNDLLMIPQNIRHTGHIRMQTIRGIHQSIGYDYLGTKRADGPGAWLTSTEVRRPSC